MAVYNTITSAALDAALLSDRSYNGYNGNAYLIPQFRVGAWAPDGSVTLADCTNPLLQKIVGVSNNPIPAHSRGLFVQSGVIPQAVAGLGAAAGQAVYLGVVAGTITITYPAGVGVTVIQIGTAEPDPMTGHITDLKLGAIGGSSGGGSGGVTPELVAAAIEASQGGDYVNGEVSFTLPQFCAAYFGPGEQILAGDASDPSKIKVAGISTSSIPVATSGHIKWTGVIEGACAGLGAVAGDPIFLAATPGGLLTKTAPSPQYDTVIVGYAVPRSGTSGAATDLLLDIQRVLVL